MIEYKPICNTREPIWKEKNPICDRWKNKKTYPSEHELISYSQRCFTVRYLREIIEKFLAKRRFEQYRHKIPEIIDILYKMGTR